ncbi:protein translocase subunit SecDF [bacterium]|jgi:SecD/SecF fusion protein|nr:protein translocase subunit SecDF [Akkermansiaceae bacterium]MDA7661590.1 protein translocase subunit SecDF [bacterium]MDA7652100.1 protein translocase subunit SecDF [Akkermansiaceae bacterium]MDA7668994.1 protein translocase subunit SecDF [Akkermansiaceae bacterium]MDB2640109.1 protein translocase subunit SecDF [Akkermansiaceae bacterium]
MDLQDNPLIVVSAGIAIVALIFWYVATEIDRRKRNVGTIAIGIVVALCLVAVLPVKEKLKGGIDLVGGSSFIVEIQPGKDEEGNPLPVNEGAIEDAKATLSKRLSKSGLSDNLMQPLGENRLIIEMPGVGPERRDEIRETIQRTARLLLKKVHPNSNQIIAQIEAGTKTLEPGYQVFPIRRTDPETGKVIGMDKILLSRRTIVGGDKVDLARPGDGLGVINVLLSKEGGKRLTNATKTMTIGSDRMAVLLDDEVLIAPTVNATLGRNFIVEGLDGREEVRTVSNALNNPLKYPLNILSERNVTARYGEEVVRQGVTAAIAGLALTLLFVLIYYRFAGFVALIGLTVNMLILFGAMAMFGATFTLPGIAGIILTIGVAVDANVLIYERLREEIAGGKSLINAIRAAYEKAFSAIFDANITTLLTAIILLWRASDQMKGFAITLTIGILSSMFAALLVTRVFFFWGSDTGALKKLSFMNLIPAKTIKFMEMRKPAFMLSSILLIGSLVVMGTKRESSLGIDFLGGSIVNIQLKEGQELSEATVKKAISDLTLEKKPTIQLEQPVGAEGDLISIKYATNDLEKIESKLRSDIGILGEKNTEGNYDIALDNETISASLGGEFLKNSFYALGLGLLAVLFYISLRFEFSFAVGAFAALFHDILICIGVVIMCGTELSLIHVGAFLTIAGYSINDTIVVFDRMRESLRSKRGDVAQVMNLAINATLSRTILTSVTTFVAVLVLWIFGGSALKDFSFAIMIGVVVGTYSSIFIAAPVVYIWSKKGSKLRQELIDASLDMPNDLAEPVPGK